ncbi:hypothetical protein [Photobacterium leiognathi]|uniref:hypothetical protein n=1 Tax=Photobacterium leiognathi TaxID=553611 RepID=UPI0029813121|nr:hypothetical protein [Photobacterium leiognathi]
MDISCSVMWKKTVNKILINLSDDNASLITNDKELSCSNNIKVIVAIPHYKKLELNYSNGIVNKEQVPLVKALRDHILREFSSLNLSL